VLIIGRQKTAQNSTSARRAWRDLRCLLKRSVDAHSPAGLPPGRRWAGRWRDAESGEARRATALAWTGCLAANGNVCGGAGRTRGEAHDGQHLRRRLFWVGGCRGRGGLRRSERVAGRSGGAGRRLGRRNHDAGLRLCSQGTAQAEHDGLRTLSARVRSAAAWAGRGATWIARCCESINRKCLRTSRNSAGVAQRPVLGWLAGGRPTAAAAAPGEQQQDVRQRAVWAHTHTHAHTQTSTPARPVVARPHRDTHTHTHTRRNTPRHGNTDTHTGTATESDGLPGAETTPSVLRAGMPRCQAAYSLARPRRHARTAPARTGCKGCKGRPGRTGALCHRPARFSPGPAPSRTLSMPSMPERRRGGEAEAAWQQRPQAPTPALRRRGPSLFARSLARGCRCCSGGCVVPAGCSRPAHTDRGRRDPCPCPCPCLLPSCCYLLPASPYPHPSRPFSLRLPLRALSCPKAAR